MRHLSDPDSSSGQSGRASLEFLLVGVLLFIPLVFATLTLWSLQNASLATEAAARHATRAFVQHTDLARAMVAAEAGAGAALQAHGISGETALQVRCKPANGCLQAGSLVELTVVAWVPVWSSPLWGVQLPVSLPLTAVHYARVSTYGGVG